MVKNMKFCGQDEKIRKYLLPNRLLWKSGRIEREDALFREKDLQIFTNEPDCMVMENTDDGINAAVLLDFGVEFSGGVRILTEMCSGNMTPDFRLTFGESAMEAMSDIGYKNSTNDHFVRDLQIKLTTFMMGIVLLVSLWASLGTSFLTFVAGFKGIDHQYYEAGMIDGITNRWQELWYITLPIMRPQMLFSAVMSISNAFGVGAISTALCGFPSTDYAVHTLMNHLTDYGGIRFEMGYASALATVLFLMMAGFNLLVQRFISKVGE